MPADLHVHTVYSDSSLTPLEIAAECYAKQVGTVAITDHDTVAGVAPTAEVAAEYDVRVVPGVEMTAYVEGTEVHIVGLFIDVEDPALLAVFERSRQVRRRRIHEMVRRLRRLDVEVPAEDVFEIAGDGVPGRVHMARALVRHGYAANVSAAFTDYIGNECPGYVPKREISPGEAADAIHAAGGVAIIAHPGVVLDDDLIHRILDQGVDGLEVYYPLHSAAQEEHFLQLARERGVLISGGSDAHGGYREETRVGGVTIDDAALARIEAAADAVRARHRPSHPRRQP
ncbi:MAG: PHP domain-containing protein [Planctomycetota bacterium]